MAEDSSEPYLDHLIRTIASPETSEDARLDATRRLRKLLSKRSPPINQVIEAGAVPYMVFQLRNMAVPTIQLESAWVLTNITSGESSQTRAVLEHGAAQVTQLT
eukprot:5949818-Pyramimonas_sp.AAC.4